MNWTNRTIAYEKLVNYFDNQVSTAYVNFGVIKLENVEITIYERHDGIDLGLVLIYGTDIYRTQTATYGMEKLDDLITEAEQKIKVLFAKMRAKNKKIREAHQRWLYGK